MLVRSSRSSATLGVHRSRLLSVGSVLLAALALSACASTVASSPPATAKPKAVGTPVPPVLAAYARLVQPVLQMSTAEAKALYSKMKSENYEVLGNDCSTFGGQFQSSQATVRGTYTPHKALAVYYKANSGYKLMLSATDECGMATDAGNKKLMKTARNDLRAGISIVDQAYTATKAWHAH